MSNKPIGGYFEWEFPIQQDFRLFNHPIFLNSGRHALEYILRGLTTIKAIYIPYFTCEVVLQPLKHLLIPYKFYRIDQHLELAQRIHLQEGEFLLYTNYYGIKDAYLQNLMIEYGEQLIVDNAQALFCPAVASHQIYSPRKFMGMPDGGIAVSTIADYSFTLPLDQSYDRCSHLLKRLEMLPSDGYDDFRNNSHKISESHLSAMSVISRRILQSVNLSEIQKNRRRNFKYLHEALQTLNRLPIPSVDSFACPLVYPFMSSEPNLKQKLISHNIFVATYWPNVFDWTSPGDLEYEISQSVVCIPIDQRYDLEDMRRIVAIIFDYFNKK